LTCVDAAQRGIDLEPETFSLAVTIVDAGELLAAKCVIEALAYVNENKRHLAHNKNVYAASLKGRLLSPNKTPRCLFLGSLVLMRTGTNCTRTGFFFRIQVVNLPTYFIFGIAL
jgi:hypothetical protein